MTAAEFKAWFSGYVEGIGSVPTFEQWLRVKERVAQIDVKPSSGKVYLDATCPTRAVLSAAAVTTPRGAAPPMDDPEEIIGTA